MDATVAGTAFRPTASHTTLLVLVASPPEKSGEMCE
jgi:hypothetical protein